MTLIRSITGELQMRKALQMPTKFVFATQGIESIAAGEGNQEHIDSCIFSLFYEKPELMRYFERIIDAVKKEKTKSP